MADNEMGACEEDAPLMGSRPARIRGDALKIAAGMCLLFTMGSIARHRTIEPRKELSAMRQVYSSEEDAEWEGFKRQFGKTYESQEEEGRRRTYYHARMAELAALNKRNGEAIFGATVHADREPGSQAYPRGRKGNGHLPESVGVMDIEKRRRLAETPAIVSPGHVDWRRTNVLTPVKNQGQCGSCWAFSATEQVESQMVLEGAAQVELSPQQITSCTKTCFGCGGGDTTLAYEYLMNSPGLAPDAFWPYVQGLTPQRECLGKLCTAACDRPLVLLETDYFYIGPYGIVDGFEFAVEPCGPGDDCSLQNLAQLAEVVDQMPVSICVNSAFWDDYTGGVMTLETCGGISYEDLDHCVQLVGYNNATETPFWLVRNSWATAWGEDGYIRLQFANHTNTCGIADEATVAIVRIGGGHE